MDPVGAPLELAIASIVALRDPSSRRRSRAASSIVSVGCTCGRGMTGAHSRTVALPASTARDELRDGVRQRLRLIDGDERAAVGDLDEARIGERRCEPPTRLDRHHLVLGGPRDEHGLPEACQPITRRLELPAATPGIAGVLAQVTT